ncbi:hypothetical protein JYU29_01305 [Tianweitania sp. BSSL-BM11]|uniref:DUF4149 domain-containing protein n=1 Tax=Tianweitania aestuarii TaxID=2814886 RepID=A0ABS5RQN7_9HYPH|nr:hypothetical protein [Tianweitania aestuarii]MBS9719321.1 hypothetical protein [Tianweitania aestuarii]
MQQSASNKRLLALAAGFVIWSIAFVVLYSALSIGCRQGWNDVHLVAGMSLQRVQLVGLYALHLACGLGLVIALRMTPAKKEIAAFLHAIAFYAAIAAVFSTAFTFAGVLLLSPC